jgi:hypothetical protein
MRGKLIKEATAGVLSMGRGISMAFAGSVTQPSESEGIPTGRAPFHRPGFHQYRGLGLPEHVRPVASTSRFQPSHGRRPGRSLAQGFSSWRWPP